MPQGALTFMATLSKLVGAHLFKLEPELRHGQQAQRLIYASAGLMRWIQEALPELEQAWTSELTPAEQLAAYVDDFCAGEELEIPTGFHCLRPEQKGVWSLKTPDLRIFGWFHTRDCFIGVKADTADRIKKHDLYLGYLGEVARFRDNIDLDEPKFIQGNNPYDVVSNYHCT